MRPALLILTAGLLLFSCRGKDALPNGVLRPPEMKLVMWDMMRADQFLSDYVFSRDSSLNHYMESAKWYGDILAIHHVSQEEFRKSFNYYNTHPALMKDLMDSIAVFPDLTKKISPARKTDSMRKIMAPAAQ
jgi:hypothetical protein